MSNHYHDDPVKKPAARRTLPKFIAAGLLMLYVFFIYQTTFAVNFRLNAIGGLEFAQSVAATAPCTGGNEIKVTPRSLFVNADNGDGTYYLSSVQIEGIPAACRGKNFDISFYDSATASSALPIYSADGANMRVATVYSTPTANIFTPGFQSSGIAVSSASGAFTVTFKTPIALAPNVKKVTLQSIEGKSGAEAISSYSGTTCILLTSSETRCWGEGSAGQLGISGTAGDRSAPVSPFGLNAVVDIDAGTDHTCAVLYDGTLKCWGSDLLGQFGNGEAAGSTTPTTIPGLSGVTAIATGQAHTCALLNTGAVKCWGWNNAAQIGACTSAAGSGATTHCKTPQDISGLGNGVVDIEAGRYHTCALLNTGDVKCWGFGTSGQLGNGTFNSSSTPVSVVDLSSPVTRIAAGGDTTCAVLSNGGARCWGQNSYGSLGNGATSAGNAWNIPQSRPQEVKLSSTTAVEISIMGHGCAVLRSGGVQCWGFSDRNQVAGSSNTGTPVTVNGLSGSAFKIAVGSQHSCAVLRTGGVQCWGGNGVGQLGNSQIFDGANGIQSVTGIP